MQKPKAFTLIELLVVISVIALLIGILVPALGAARKAAQAAESLSNVRQWGVGTMLSLDDRKRLLPWDGNDNPAGAGGFTAKNWWANVVPPYLNQEGYAKLVADRIAAGKQIPLPPEKSIFIDGTATVPAAAPYGAGSQKYFFCYVPNSKLDTDSLDIDPANGQRVVRFERIKTPDNTVLMLEIRTIRDELPSTDPMYTKTLDRTRADWQRFAARHRNGGHILFADGHAAFVLNQTAITQGAPGDYNQPGKLIWNPLGIAD